MSVNPLDTLEKSRVIKKYQKITPKRDFEMNPFHIQYFDWHCKQSIENSKIYNLQKNPKMPKVCETNIEQIELPKSGSSHSSRTSLSEIAQQFLEQERHLDLGFSTSQKGNKNNKNEKNLPYEISEARYQKILKTIEDMILATYNFETTNNLNDYFKINYASDRHSDSGFGSRKFTGSEHSLVNSDTDLVLPSIPSLVSSYDTHSFINYSDFYGFREPTGYQKSGAQGALDSKSFRFSYNTPPLYDSFELLCKDKILVNKNNVISQIYFRNTSGIYNQQEVMYLVNHNLNPDGFDLLKYLMDEYNVHMYICSYDMVPMFNQIFKNLTDLKMNHRPKSPKSYQSGQSERISSTGSSVKTWELELISMADFVKSYKLCLKVDATLCLKVGKIVSENTVNFLKNIHSIINNQAGLNLENFDYQANLTLIKNIVLINIELRKIDITLVRMAAFNYHNYRYYIYDSLYYFEFERIQTHLINFYGVKLGLKLGQELFELSIILSKMNKVDWLALFHNFLADLTVDILNRNVNDWMDVYDEAYEVLTTVRETVKIFQSVTGRLKNHIKIKDIAKRLSLILPLIARSEAFLIGSVSQNEGISVADE